jgi:hypothetical protein
MSETTGAQLVIIHNYENQSSWQSYQKYCNTQCIKYIPRNNVGFDIGAFQDVCLNRLNGFPEFDYLLWCTDDNIPMRKDFIRQFLDKFTRDIGCVAMQLSKEVKPHIRTTGFMVSKSTMDNLTFPRETILTKDDCYQFEHRSKNNFLDQIIKLKLKAIQISEINVSPLWDSGHKKTKTRRDEHYLIFTMPSQSTKKVAFICPIFNTYPEIISSLINQTHENWVLYLIHDGPSSMDMKSIVKATNDERIIYIETQTRAGNWGHSLRSEWLQKLKTTDTDYIVITNADNHHAPTYCEYLLRGFTNGQVATYCSKMVHSYTGWDVIKCRLELGYIDCAGVMVKKDVACEIGWSNVTDHSADWIYFNEIIKKYGKEKFAEVNGCLLSHN